jgi:glycine dehydrogenase subunit 2
MNQHRNVDVIFAANQAGARAALQAPREQFLNPYPEKLQRKRKAMLPAQSELQTVRHYTRLSKRNFSIDGEFYPLGSCTMKYNPRDVHHLALLPGFINRHPLTSLHHSQGFLSCVYGLQEILREVTGMHAVSLTPMAGAQGEFAGVAMIRAYHQSRNDVARTEMIVPDAAHGTNPASAVMCGYTVREIPTGANGDIDLEALRSMVSEKTAGIMLTNPSTLGVFERNIQEVAKIVHQAGGLLYYDGANLNAILGKVRPGDMGFDVMHINLHKTFATPHGGGGPGAGPVAVAKRLAPFLPVPIAATQGDKYFWLTENECPETIGRLSTFMGNAGIILRAYIYARILGCEGLQRVAQYATLNANYLMTLLKKNGYDLAYPMRRASHEFIVTMQKQAKELNITATDIAKRLLDYGYHAPTIYFPLLVPECLLIEPTETESKQTIERFAEVMAIILNEAKETPDLLREAPHTLPVRRLDEVAAAKNLDLVYREQQD